MSKETFLEYFKTFFITILVSFGVIIVFLVIMQHQVYEGESTVEAQDNTIDYALVNILIDKNKYLETQDKNNYRINLKLGSLYEVKKEYDNAEAEYKKAIYKAPYGEYFPEYKLACLYLVINRLEEAQAVMDNIDEEPDKKLIGYKADIYNKLADKYYNTGDYEEAGFKYQQALSYYKILKSPEVQVIEGDIASSYIYLADEKVNQMQIQDAIDYLQMAKSIIDAPIIKYKLALLLTKSNPVLAYQYFEEVFKVEPKIINYDEYYNFLMDLAENAETKGDIAEADLYRYKAEKLKEYFKTNILSVEDLSVEDIKGRIKLNRWTQKYVVNLEFKLRNISEYAINSLYLEIVFRDDSKLIDSYMQRVVDKPSALGVADLSPIIGIKTYIKKTKSDTSPKKITVELYVAKTEKAYKLLLKKIELQEVVKKKSHSKLLQRFAEFFAKITSKFPF